MASAELAHAAAVREGFDANSFPANDDGSVSAALPFTVNFFGDNYSSLFVNNNGNATFDAALGTFTPFDLTSTAQVIIAPFFGDVDTRGAGSSVVTYGSGSVDGRDAFAINWVDVGYYSYGDDLLNSFQLVIIDRSDVDAGDFDFEFNYDQIQWETGEASGGTGGLGGDSARAGYSNGTGDAGTFFELEGSAVNGAFLDTNLNTGLIHNLLNSDVAGSYVFEVRSGIVVATRFSLTPQFAVNSPVADEHTLTATLRDDEGVPLSGEPITFEIVSGPNAGSPETHETDPDGESVFTYTGSGAAGVDVIEATFVENEDPPLQAFKFWDLDCNGNGIADTCDLDAEGFGGVCGEVNVAGQNLDVNEDGIPDECLFVNDPATVPGWGEGVDTYAEDGIAYAFVAAQDQGLFVYEIPDRDASEPPTTPEQVGGSFLPDPTDCSDPFFDDLTIENHHAFVAGGRCGLLVLDIEEPTTPPVLRGIFSAPIHAEHVSVASAGEGSAIAYVADYFEGLWIVEISGLEPPEEELTFSDELLPIPGAPIAIAIEGAGSETLVYVATTEGLSIVSPNLPVGDATLPEVLGSCTTNPDGLDLDDLDSIPQDVAVGGGFAYVPLWLGGLGIVDVSNPAALDGNECVGAPPLQAPLGTNQAYYSAIVSESGNRLYVTEGQCGLRAFAIDDSNLEELSVSPIPIAYDFDCLADPPYSPIDLSRPFAWNIHEASGVVFVSFGSLEPREGGLQVIEFTVDGPPPDGIVAGSEPDEDADGVADSQDNCLDTPNADQTDSDLDGFGNACDADYDGNSWVGLSDFGIFSAAYGASSSDDHYDARADHNADGSIGLLDFGVFSQRWGNPPGPSGLACAGSVPCP